MRFDLKDGVLTHYPEDNSSGLTVEEAAVVAQIQIGQALGRIALVLETEEAEREILSRSNSN